MGRNHDQTMFQSCKGTFESSKNYSTIVMLSILRLKPRHLMTFIVECSLFRVPCVSRCEPFHKPSQCKSLFESIVRHGNPLPLAAQAFFSPFLCRLESEPASLGLGMFASFGLEEFSKSQVAMKAC